MKRIYLAHGGEEVVVGGKVTILEGAVIDDRREAHVAPTAPDVAVVPDSTATTIAALRADYNALLEVLRAAHLIAGPND